MQDATIRSRFILLGQTSPVLGSISLFSNNEPIMIQKMTVILSAASPSIESLLLYDNNKRYLGRANLDTSDDTGKKYVVSIPTGNLTLPKQQTVILYVRGTVRSANQGGVSGQVVQANSFVLEGNGEWSSEGYTQTFADTFPVFQTSRARITAVQNAGSATDTFVSGPGRQISSFRFMGDGESEGLAALKLTGLTLQIDGGSSIALSNVSLRREGTNETMNCSSSTTEVTCSSIPAVIGTLQGGQTTLTVFADIFVASGVTNPTLRLTLNQPGTVSTAGAISWTDGSATFSWVPFDAPVARGTQYQ